MSAKKSHGRPRSAFWIGCTLALACLLGAGAARAEIRPSSDVLVPYFEVGLAPDSTLTTLFAVCNGSNRSQDVVFTVHTNWGIPVLTYEREMAGDEVATVNLRDWLVLGQLPDRTLAPPELAHLQAALSGQLSPQDNLYYSTETADDKAVGYVTIKVHGGGRPDVLWGDYFLVDPVQECFQGDNLVNVDMTDLCDALCEEHAIRFLDGGAFDDGTELVIWTGRRWLPSPTPEPAGLAAALDAVAYDEPGRYIAELTVPLLPVQVVRVRDLALPERFGWLALRTAGPSFIGARFTAVNHTSAALHSYCLPEEGRAEGPSIRIEKLVEEDEADEPPGPSFQVGTTLHWTYRVKNDGGLPLSDVTVTDDAGIEVSCPGTTLAPDEAMVCTATSAAAACLNTNLATATGFTPDGTAASASDPANYTGLLRAGIEIEKRVNGEDADSPPGPTLQVGETIAWTFVVTNNGDAPLAGVQVTDDGVPVACPKAKLAPGESMTCSAAGTAVAGDHASLGAVEAEPPCGPPVSASDPANYRGWQPWPSLTIEKSTQGMDADLPPGPMVPLGQPVQWTYLVTNTGDLPLDPVVVSDDKGVAVTCPKTALQPGESMTCSASGVATACQYANVGAATGTPPAGQGGPVAASDPSHYFGQHHAAVAIEKRTNGEDADMPPGPSVTVGSAVAWTYMVTNTGDVPLTAVAVSDDRGAVVTCPKTELAAGESMACTAAGTAFAGQYRNVGAVTGTPPCGPPIPGFDLSHYLGVSPSIALEKLVNGQDADSCTQAPTVLVGAPVLWTYVVTNTGDVALSEVAVTDDQDVAVTCPKTTLAAGESMTCTAAGTAVAGQHANVGSVAGQSPQGVSVTAQDSSCYAGYSPGIALEKRVNGQDMPPGPTLLVGSTVAWTYVVTNTGDVRLTGVTVTDNQGVAVTCPKTMLEAAESMTCTGTGTAVAGLYANIGTATGTPPIGPAVTASDPAHYRGVTAAISLQKLTNGEDADTPPGPSIMVGSPVLWTYVVTNTGEMGLTQVGVTDSRRVAVTCPKTMLDPGESMTCTASGTAVAGQYSNVGTATGTPAGGSAVTAQDPSHYHGWTPGNQGCTPGYWKNHTDSWPPAGYSPTQIVKSVFVDAWHYQAGFPSLLEALGFAGGSGLDGAAEILLRAGVAALLNAAHPGVAYPRTTAEVITSVNTALASQSRDTMLALAAQLDADNNLGCPLN